MHTKSSWLEITSFMPISTVSLCSNSLSFSDWFSTSSGSPAPGLYSPWKCCSHLWSTSSWLVVVDPSGLVTSHGIFCFLSWLTPIWPIFFQKSAEFSGAQSMCYALLTVHVCQILSGQPPFSTTTMTHYLLCNVSGNVMKVSGHGSVFTATSRSNHEKRN